MERDVAPPAVAGDRPVFPWVQYSRSGQTPKTMPQA